LTKRGAGLRAPAAARRGFARFSFALPPLLRFTFTLPALPGLPADFRDDRAFAMTAYGTVARDRRQPRDRVSGDGALK
jgi:hypothetical protein